MGIFDVEDVVGAQVDTQVLVRLIAGECVDQRVVSDLAAARCPVVLHLAAHLSLPCRKRRPSWPVTCDEGTVTRSARTPSESVWPLTKDALKPAK